MSSCFANGSADTHFATGSTALNNEATQVKTKTYEDAVQKEHDFFLKKKIKKQFKI